jgi:signal transduction histidine kinase/ligand-binding sensor domain-containing protein/DNA-binding response OmpR family regulator
MLPAHAQETVFGNLSTADGLPHTYVNALYQDENDRVWIGTFKGLSCYDGSGVRQFKTYENTINRNNSMYVKAICGNGDGKMFVAYDNIVALYDMAADTFSTIARIRKISDAFYRDSLYVCQEHRIWTYDERNGSFSLFFAFADPSIAINKLFVDTSARLWVGTTAGLYRLDAPYDTPIPLIGGSSITSLYQDGDGNVWVGSDTDGIYVLQSDGFLTERFAKSDDDENGLSSNFVRAILEDNTGFFWIGTFLGLDRFDPQTGQFAHYRESEHAGGLSNSSIWSLMKDRQGTLWVGTYHGGLNYFDPQGGIYTHYRPSADESRGLSSKVVGRILCDEENNVWIATEGGGLNVYSPKTDSYRRYPYDGRRAGTVSESSIKALYYDEAHKEIWVGTHLGGLDRLETGTGRFTYYRATGDSASLSNDIVKAIVPYRDSLIVGTHGGVDMLSPATGEFRHIRSEKLPAQPQIVNDLFIARDSTLWISLAGHGIYSYRFDRQDVVRQYCYQSDDPKSVSDNWVSDIYQARDGLLWLATYYHGVDILDPRVGVVERYNTLNSDLISDCVYNIVESPYSGTLYLVTDRGLSSFDPSRKGFRRYHTLPLKTLNQNAIHIKPDGEVFLGGTDGMVSFHEDDLLADHAVRYKILPYALKVDDKTIGVGDATGILSASLLYSPRLRFKCRHSFAIYFSTTDYASHQGNQVSYRLEGFSDAWSHTDGEKVIQYTNLPPGHYTLRLEARDPAGAMADSRSIDIDILPPWYRTNTAYLLYALALFAALFFGMRIYDNRVRLQETIKLDEKRIRDIEELNQYKLDFFANISHELKTPLTLINMQVEMMLKGKEVIPRVERRLHTVRQVVREMHELIAELLDFRKQEKKQFRIHVGRHDIVGFVEQAYLTHKEYAASQRKPFTLDSPDEPVYLWFDTKQMRKVMNNILSNAFKYTVAGQSIRVSVDDRTDEVAVTIEDGGKGIDTRDIDHVFDSFYQAKDALSGTGIGLALVKNIIELHGGKVYLESEKNVKTALTFVLRKGKDHFSDEQLVERQPADTSTDIPTLPALPEADTPTSPPGTVKILLVEDNKPLLQALGELFAPIYAVFTASDGVEGLDVATREQPDIIVSDVLMPEMSGIELCHHLKSNLATSHIPVVLLTARSGTEHTIEGLREGADDYLTKPFDVDILVHKCNNLVRNRAKLREAFGKRPQERADILATNKLDKAFMDQVLDIVERHIADPDFNVDSLARQLGIARTNVFAKIKAISGQTPNHFILTLRLQKAAFLLRTEPGRTVENVAWSVGISSLKYFRKCFKQAYDVSPAQYRLNTTEDTELHRVFK